MATVGEVAASVSVREGEGAGVGGDGDGDGTGQIGRRREEGEVENAYEVTWSRSGLASAWRASAWEMGS